MFSRIVILLVFLAAASEVCAQTLTVVSKDSGIPLPAAAVRVFADTGTRVLMHTEETDEQGTVQLTVPVLPAVVEVQRSGYEQELVKLKAIPTELRVSLTPRLHVMDEVVVTGVPSPIKLQDALASYRVITAATIQAQGAVTLNEALANQLNLSVGNDALLGAGIRMQGMNGDKVKTLMDGVALNGREGGNIDMGQINLYNAERIEVVQGPMSIIYGSDALGGVINVIEKQRRRPFEAFATAHYESIGKYNVQAGLSKAWKRHRLQAGGGRNYFQGWKYLDEPVGYNQDTVQAQRHMLFKPKEQYLANLGYQYQSAKGTKIRFASDLLREKVTNKGAVRTFNPFTVAATDEYYRTTRSVNRLTLEGKLKERLSWQIINGYTYYRRVRTTYEKDLTTLAQTLSEASGVQDTSLFQDYASRGMFSGNAGRFELTGGYDLNLQRAESGKIPGERKKIDDYAAFALATIALLPERNLKVQAGLRGSYNTQFSAPLIPAVNILYSMSPDIQLRASYAKGFRAPSLKEMYLSFVDANHEILGNSGLKAEEGDHLQLSLSGRMYQQGNDFAQLLVTGYYNDVKNGIMLVPLRPEDTASIEYMYVNLASQRNVIGNLQFQGQLGYLHYSLGYAYAHTFSQSGYNSFSIQELNGSLYYFLKGPAINMAVFYKLTGAQPFLRSNIDGSASYDGRQPAYQMLDASLERKFWKKRISLTAGVKNILDVQALNATGLQGGGAHSGGGTVNFLPRSIFTTLRLQLDQ